MLRLILFSALLFFLSCTASGQNVNSKPSAGSDLKVMTYNIHAGNPPSKPKVIDIDAIINAIKAQKPDLVALQEVDVNTARSGKINEAEIIARKLGMNFFFAKAIDHDGGDYGIAILSKYPLSETKIHRLTTVAGTGGEPRVLATAKIHLKNGKFLRFGSTHLDAQNKAVNRLIQIKEINQIASKESLPFIIAGDLNAETESEVIKKLGKVFTRTCQNCGPTFPVISPEKTIDFIAFRPAGAFKVISHTVVQEHYASDHLPVLALLQYDF